MSRPRKSCWRLAVHSSGTANATRSETQWKAALDVNSKLGEAHNNLAVIDMQTGRLNEADQEIKLAEKNGFRVNRSSRMI
jgi:hypothetical protein